MAQISSSETKPGKLRMIVRPPGGYSKELENFLQTRASLLGEHSNYGGLVASIQRGGSGGNRGTKGVGIVRVEPFEDWEHLGALHKAFGRDTKCERAWRALTSYERWLLCARYLGIREQLPVGMLGQLGDLAVVAYVVADRLGLRVAMDRDARKNRTSRWGYICSIALQEAHRAWFDARAEVDSEDVAAQEDPCTT
jgi:hypothetical protein